MKKIIIIIGCLYVMVVVAIILGVNYIHSDNVVEELSKSVVLLEVYDDDDEMVATGSGYFIYDDKTIVTNYHVIEDAYSVTAISDSGTRFKIDTMIDYNEDKDIAILKCNESTKIPHVPFAEMDKLKKGQEVIAIGSPLGIQNTVSTGVISSFDDKNDVMKIHTTAPISNGSSGGLLATEDGKTIGVTSASYVDSQNLNIAIDIREVMTLYEDDLKKGTLLSDFFDSKEHFYKYKEINAAELLINYKRHQDEKMCVTGWVSTSCYDDEGAYNVLYLVGNPDEVISTGTTVYIPSDEIIRASELKVIIIPNHGDKTKIEAGQQVKIYGEIKYDVMFERIKIDPYKIEILD